MLKVDYKIRDTNTGKWLDTSVFREAALRFMSKGYYCEYLAGTPEWIDYWKEELRRCVEGFAVIDKTNKIYKITGHHYAYLNYAQISLVKFSDDEDDEGDSLASKEISFPDFWDGDYNFFWSLDIARFGIASSKSATIDRYNEKKKWLDLNKQIKKELKNDVPNQEIITKLKEQRDEYAEKILGRLGLYVKPHPDYLDGGYHFVVGKSRRKGYSYKLAFICANTYNTVRNSLTLIGAYEKKFVEPTMQKATEYLNFINEYTAWSKNRLLDKRDIKMSGYIENIGGVNIEKGYKSVLDATRTFKDNPDAMRGVDAYFILLEESGAFDNLKNAYNAIIPSLTAGSKITGQICIIGTSGDMYKGTVDYADMFYNPVAYGLMPFINTWDEGGENTTCGFFHPVTWNMEGFYDRQGNSDIEGATKWEMKRRQKILDNSSSPLLLQKHMQEFPLCPADAFSVSNVNVFPVTELRNQLNKVIANNLNQTKGTPVTLTYENGKVKAIPDIKKELQPIYNYKPKLDNLDGCPIIYEYPVNNAPRGLYKIGFDPYRQDMSSGVSLAAIYVVKGVHKGSQSKNCIVAEYVGRPNEADDANRIAAMLAELYNTEIMHENEVTQVKNYFRRVGKLNLLASQPDRVISSNIKESKVARVYGCHMNAKLKDAGEKYLKDWLLEVQDYDEHCNPVTTIDTIYSIGVLEELIQYNRRDNFDRVSALFMCMMQVQEEALGKVYESKENNSRVSEMIALLNKRNNRML